MSKPNLPPLPPLPREVVISYDPDGAVYGQDNDELIAWATAYAEEAVRQALAKDEPVAWESTTPVYFKFVTDSRYRKFSQKVRSWYRPYRCANCAALPAPPETRDG